MYTFKRLLAVTDRTLCTEPFLERIEELAACRPAGILLREKDLEEAAYTELARQVLAICARHQTACILHSHPEAARLLGCPNIHLPMGLLRQMAGTLEGFQKVGASVHSGEEAREAQKLGASYLVAGHIFATDCKKGVPPRGLGFLREVCQAVSIPVYAIGGITEEKEILVLAQGAAGYCVRSGVMQNSLIDKPGPEC